MKYLQYNSLIEAQTKADFIYTVGKANGIFSEQTTKFCDVKLNKAGDKFYAAYSPDRTQGFGYTTEDLQYVVEGIDVFDDAWHELDKLIKIRLNNAQNTAMLEQYDMMTTYRKENNIPTFTIGEYVYFYVNWIYNAHKQMIESFNPNALTVAEGYELVFNEVEQKWIAEII